MHPISPYTYITVILVLTILTQLLQVVGVPGQLQDEGSTTHLIWHLLIQHLHVGLQFIEVSLLLCLTRVWVVQGNIAIWSKLMHVHLLAVN